MTTTFALWILLTTPILALVARFAICGLIAALVARKNRQRVGHELPSRVWHPPQDVGPYIYLSFLSVIVAAYSLIAPDAQTNPQSTSRMYHLWLIVAVPAGIGWFHLERLVISSIDSLSSISSGRSANQRLVSAKRVTHCDPTQQSLLRSLRILTIAAVEELLYRGSLWSVLGLHGLSQHIVLVITTALFGVAHIRNGAIECLLKSGVGLVLGSLVILGGRVEPAIVAHLTFNALTLRQPTRRDSTRPNLVVLDSSIPPVNDSKLAREDLR